MLAEKAGRKRYPRGAAIVELVAGAALGVAIGLGLLRVARISKPHDKELAQQAACGARLQTVGKAVGAYHEKNKYRDPPDAAALLIAADLSPKDLVCPSSGRKPAQTEDADDVDEYDDYVLVWGVRAMEKDLLRGFELPADHHQDGANVLLGAEAPIGTLQAAFQTDLSVYVGRLQGVNEYLAQRRVGR